MLAGYEHDSNKPDVINHRKVRCALEMLSMQLSLTGNHFRFHITDATILHSYFILIIYQLIVMGTGKNWQDLGGARRN